MNKLDFPPRGFVTRQDSGTGRATNGNTPVDPESGDAFAFLLNGLSSQERTVPPPALGNTQAIQARGEGTVGQDVAEALTTLIKGHEGSCAESDSQTDTLSEQEPMTPGSHAPQETGSGVVSAVQSLLLLLPRGHSAMTEEAPRLGARALSPLPMPSDQVSSPKAPSGSILPIHVQHQEAHFSPVIDRLSTKLVPQASPNLDETADHESGDALLAHDAKKVDQSKMALQTGQMPLENGSLSQEGSRQKSDEDGNVSRVVSRGAVALGDSQNEASPAVDSDSNSALPPATLQRLASAILDQTGPMRAAARSAAQAPDGTSFVTTAKASEGVMRVLNIQLHPAELGLITIRMRLSGDDLGMEIQVSSEETARLLKADTEKLSNLLRGSGYRADTISIHIGQAETAQQGSFPQSRESPLAQSQQDAFRQGASQQDGHPHRSKGGYETEHTESRHDTIVESPSLNSNTGAVYL
jgi:flagellar hook-length control protein FliK